MTNALSLGCSLLLLLSALAGCGGGRTVALPSAEAGPAPGGEASAKPAPLGVSLPGLAQLRPPMHAASDLGPGWLPLEQGAVVASSGLTPGAGEAISLLGVPDFAYAIYCAYGFDGDNGPTSARVTSPAASGKFYVAFSNYQDGTWLFTGPYSFGASGGTTEITIPNSGEFVSPHAFIGNYFNATYLAVVAQKGASLSDATVELGVHGGRLGPRPPASIFASGNATGCTVGWRASLDELSPDFGGYLVERAEIWTGGYTPLNPAPIRDCWLSDPGAQNGHTYRYRAAAVDVNGNRSVWTEGFGLLDNAYNQRLVPVVSGVPNGPVYGPVTLDLNMGASYDPEGDPIDTYSIKDWNDEIYSSAAYAVNLTLQPGCHKLYFRIVSGSKTGEIVKYVKVLPQWQPVARFVSSPQVQNALPRINALSMKRTADGALHLLGYDPFIPGFIDRRVELGVGSQLFTAPAYDELTQFCEPVVVGNEILFGTTHPYGWDVYSCTPTGIRYLRSDFMTGPQPNPQFQLVSDGAEQLWMVLAEDDGVFKLRIQSLVFASPSDLVDPLPSLLDVDAVYDPALSVIWVVYSTNASTEWIKVNPLTLGVMDNGTLAGFASPKVDVEFDAVNNIPVAAYYSLGNIYYSWNDGLWHLGEQVDPTGNNGTAFDLDCALGAPHIAMGEIGGQTSVYTRTGVNTWAKLDVAYSAASGMQLGLAAYDDGGLNYAVADAGTNRHVYGDWIEPDTTQHLFFDQWPTTGQGMQLHGAAGSDGLHVVWDQLLGGPVHLLGTADGVSWSSAAMPANVQQLDLVALADGTVYGSWNDAGNATLHRWDAPAWTPLASLPSTSTVRPFFAQGKPTDVVSWLAFNDATQHLHAWSGNQANGYTTGDALFNGHYAFSGTGVLEAETAGPEFASKWYILHANSLADYENSRPGVFDPLNYDNNTLISHGLNPDAFHSTYVFGRNAAAAEYLSDTNTLEYAALWLSNGVNAPAMRYTPNYPRVSELADLPANFDAPGFDARRTVSAATVPHCLTAVALVCDLGGHDQYLEWSNYGQWERLPLPPPDGAYASERHMNQPQLFVGQDGRWHIIYRNYDTDTIYCRSTL